MSADKTLHLPSLTIKGFRGVKDLTIPRLGRATLLAGMNGAGKTTVLDAVRVFASRGSRPVLADMLRERGETAVFTDEYGESRLEPDWSALFHGRVLDADSSICIGQPDAGNHLEIRARQAEESPFGEYAPSLAVSFSGCGQEYAANLDCAGYRLSKRRQAPSRKSGSAPPALACESLGPGLPSGYDLARFWDSVALTDEESRAVESLRLIFGGGVERAAFVGEESDAPGRSGRRAMVKMKGESRPVPLASLGGGAVRAFGVALALASARGGFLLLDEAENGIHHSLQRDFWKMVMLAARENGVQVIAATHSRDCVKGFAYAASELDNAAGLLHRIENVRGKARAVSYSEEGLKVAAEQGIEVR